MTQFSVHPTAHTVHPVVASFVPLGGDDHDILTITLDTGYRFSVDAECVHDTIEGAEAMAAVWRLADEPFVEPEQKGPPSLWAAVS